MLNIKKVIALLLSLLIGLLAVKFYSVLTRPKLQDDKSFAAEKEAKDPAVDFSTPKAFSCAIPNGFRVITIEVDNISGVTPFIQKDDRVDVIAVTDVKQSFGGKLARLVLQNALVYQMDTDLTGKGKDGQKWKKTKKWAIKLLVDTDAAVLLSSVDAVADLRLVLRNPEDDNLLPEKAISYLPEIGVATENALNPRLAGQIRTGMRAVCIPVDNQDGLADRLHPGDWVDIIASAKVSLFSTEDGNMAVGTAGEVHSLQKSSRILIQNVKVLGTDQPFGVGVGLSKPVTKVNLLVTPKQAEQLAVMTDASKSGILRLVLRSEDDKTKIATQGEIFSDQILSEKRSFRVVEIIRGVQISPQKFYTDEHLGR